MPTETNDNTVDGGADVDNGEHGAAGERTSGGHHSSAAVYCNRREFLIASACETRPAWVMSCGCGDDIDNEWWGFANTEKQFRDAVASVVIPGAYRLNKDELRRIMADELKGEE